MAKSIIKRDAKGGITLVETQSIVPIVHSLLENFSKNMLKQVKKATGEKSIFLSKSNFPGYDVMYDNLEDRKGTSFELAIKKPIFFIDRKLAFVGLHLDLWKNNATMSVEYTNKNLMKPLENFIRSSHGRELSRSLKKRFKLKKINFLFGERGLTLPTINF